MSPTKRSSGPRRKRTEQADDETLTHLYRPLTPSDFDLIAIDPGDKYTGVAFFKRYEDGWECVDAQEFSPHDFEDALAELLLLNPLEVPFGFQVVYERWRLYADHAMEKVGNEFLASQHIGVIRYIVRVHNDHVIRHERAEDLGKMMTCELQGGKCATGVPNAVFIGDQVADIKKPTAGILNKKKIKSVAGPIAKADYQGRDHIKDAELHGWYRILNKMKQQARPSAIR